jgi:hypothetical protein
VPAANQATPPDYPDAVFFLEASLMHGRNLLEFLKKGRFAVAPADVGVDPLPTGLNAHFSSAFGDGKTIEEAYGGLCAFLDHLSPSRVCYGDEWVINDPVRLANALVEVLDVVFAREDEDGQIPRALADGRTELKGA